MFLSNKENPNGREGLLEIFTNGAMPYYVAWHYACATGALRYIGNRAQYPHLWSITYTHLLKMVKRCFADVYRSILSRLASGPLAGTEPVYVELELPLRIGEAYTLVKQILVPVYEGGELTDLFFVGYAMRPYNNEPFACSVYRSNAHDEPLTAALKSCYADPLEFSRTQSRVKELITKGLSSKEIALFLDRSLPAIHKMNRKLLDKISGQFGMPFVNVREAARFYDEVYC